LILAAVVALQALEVVFGQGIFFSHDLRHHHFPWRFWADSAWASGSVPLWSAEVGNGFPLMADGQAGVLYPVNILLGALLPTHWALSWSLLLHQWWAGLGAFLLVRDLSKDRPASFEAALFGGVAFALSGFVVSHFTYAGMVQAAAWLPWGLWVLQILCREQGPQWPLRAILGWAACVGAVMTAGHPQVGAICLFTCGLFFLGQRAGRRVWLWVVGGSFIGLMACLPQLLASLELAAESTRSGGVGAEFASMGALPPQELINVAFPHFWGWETPASLPWTYVHKGLGYFGTGENHWESCFFVGLPVVVLAAWAFFQSGHRLWKGLVVLSLLLALGGLTPLYGALRSLPGFDFFRFPARFTLVASLGLIVLASGGLDRILSDEAAESRRKLGWWIRGAVVLGVGSMALVGSQLAGRRQDLVASAAQATGDLGRATGFVDGLLASLSPLAAPNLQVWIVALLVALLLGLRSRGVASRRVARSLVILLVVDLSALGMNYNPATAPAAATQAPASLNWLKKAAGQRMAVVDRVQDPQLDPALLSASLGLVWGAQEVAVLSPLALPRNEAILALTGLDVGLDHGPKKVFDALAHLHLVDMMGVGLLYSVHALPHPNLRLLSQVDGVNVYENSGAMPRVFAVGNVRSVASSEAALQAMAAPFDPRKTVFVEDGLDAEEPDFSARVQIETMASDEIEVSTELSAPGVLVLTDTFYPGWKVWVNGQEAPLLRANSTFKAVALPAGVSAVRFAYSPAWKWTLWLWALSWLGILGGFLILGWRAKADSA
jgi:hypothetical protein